MLRSQPNRPYLATALTMTAADRTLWFFRDIALTLAMFTLYFIARGQAGERIDAAVALSHNLVRFEEMLGIFIEPAVQRAALTHTWVTELANGIYAYLHFPVMAAIGVWLWWRNRDGFVFLRNVVFVSMVVGLVFYYLLPAAPPRLLAAHGLDYGFVDTLFGGNTAVNYAHPSLITNEYAAIPSYHFGWILLSAMAVWTNTISRVLRTTAALLVTGMSWAIVATANHLLIDMVLGGLVIVLSWWIVQRFLPQADRPAGA